MRRMAERHRIGGDDLLADRPQRDPGKLQMRPGKGNADDSHREYDRGDSHLKLAGIALWPIGKETVAADALPFSHSAQR